MTEITRPGLIILIGHQTSKAAKVISDLHFSSVVSVETTNYNEDKRAHIFVEKLYSCLSKGMFLEESFEYVRS